MICSMSPATQWKKFALKHRHQISYFIFLTIVMPVFNKYYVLFLLLVVQQRWHTRMISKHFLKTRIKKKTKIKKWVLLISWRVIAITTYWYKISQRQKTHSRSDLIEAFGVHIRYILLLCTYVHMYISINTYPFMYITFNPPPLQSI